MTARSMRSWRSSFDSSWRSLIAWMWCEPMLLVRMITVFLKSTVRPCPSVRRPSSSTWSSTFQTSRVRLLDLVEQHDRVRAPPHGLRELPPLVVADVARRRADEPRDGVLLHVLAHVEPDHRLLVVEQELRQRARQLGLADARRPEKEEAPDGPLRVAEPGPRAAHRVRHGVDRLLLPDDALLAASSSMCRSFSISPWSILLAGIPVHLATMRRDVLVGHLLASGTTSLSCTFASVFRRSSSLFSELGPACRT